MSNLWSVCLFYKNLWHDHILYIFIMICINCLWHPMKFLCLYNLYSERTGYCLPSFLASDMVRYCPYHIFGVSDAAWSSMVPQSPPKSSIFQQWSRKFPQRPACWTCGTMLDQVRYFDWPWDHRPPASSSTMAVFIDDRPSESRRIHHRRPSARVWGSAVMYSRCSTTSPQRFVWRKVARGSSCLVVTGSEVSSRTIGIAPRINKFDRIKLIVNYK